MTRGDPKQICMGCNFLKLPRMMGQMLTFCLKQWLPLIVEQRKFGNPKSLPIRPSITTATAVRNQPSFWSRLWDGKSDKQTRVSPPEPISNPPKESKFPHGLQPIALPAAVNALRQCVEKKGINFLSLRSEIVALFGGSCDEELEVRSLIEALKFALMVKDEQAAVQREQIHCLQANCSNALSVEEPVPTLLESLRMVREHILRSTLRMILAAGCAPWRRSRLLVVGYGGAGKTCFVSSLRQLRYNNNHVSTAGMTRTDLLHRRVEVSWKHEDEDEDVNEIGVSISSCDNSWGIVSELSDLQSSLRYATAKLFHNPPAPPVVGKSDDLSTAMLHPTQTTEPLQVPSAAPMTDSDSESSLSVIKETRKLVMPILAQEDTSLQQLSPITFSELTPADVFASVDRKDLMFSVWDFGGQLTCLSNCSASVHDKDRSISKASCL